MDGQKPDFSNKAYLFPYINREGVRFGIIALVIALLVVNAAFFFGLAAWFAIPALLLAWGVFLFFRDPDRYPPDDENAILSPADGRICLIEKCKFPDSLEDDTEHWRVSVFMSVFNVHVNRMPTAGKIKKLEYIAAGKFFNASLDKASKENERCNYLVESEKGVKYAVTQIAGLVARRIVPQVKEGDTKRRAERFGLIRFGSRLDVYLPVGVEPAVKVGQTMVAGETVLGRLT